MRDSLEYRELGEERERERGRERERQREERERERERRERERERERGKRREKVVTGFLILQSPLDNSCFNSPLPKKDLIKFLASSTCFLSYNRT